MYVSLELEPETGELKVTNIALGLVKLGLFESNLRPGSSRKWQYPYFHATLLQGGPRVTEDYETCMYVLRRQVQMVHNMLRKKSLKIQLSRKLKFWREPADSTGFIVGIPTKASSEKLAAIREMLIPSYDFISTYPTYAPHVSISKRIQLKYPFQYSGPPAFMSYKEVRAQELASYEMGAFLCQKVLDRNKLSKKVTLKVVGINCQDTMYAIGDNK